MTEPPAIPAAERTPPDAYVTEAIRIGDDLCGAARPLADGSLTWGRGEGLDRSACVDSGLFNGRVGEALFLGALFQVTRHDPYRRAAVAALAGITGGAGNPAYVADFIGRTGIGLRGAGGLIYGLARCADFLDAPALRADAVVIASAAVAQSTTAQLSHGIMFGTAGLLLGLISLAERQPSLLDGVHVLSTRLMDERIIDAHTGLRGWQVRAGSGVSGGFAHGSTGIAHALLKASHLTGDTRYADASFELFDFERSLHRPDVGQWPESHADAGDGIISWCHRAPGFGFARLSHRALQRAGVDADVRAAIRISRAVPLTQLDGLCCGNLGRAELFLEAGVRLEDEALVSQARRLGMVVIARARTRGYGLPPGKEQMAPGLWQGMAGIGYSLLRLSHPRGLPCILMME